MNLVDSYKTVKGSVIAFTQKYQPVYGENPAPPQFPHIIGTGFVIHEDGLIATNRHVVKAFPKLFRPPGTNEDDWGVIATLFKQTEEGQLEIPLEVLGVLQFDGFTDGKHYYGPKDGPDFAIVHVKARGLPTLTVDTSVILEEGMLVATSGFPMGTDALTAPGYLHQITPTLQTGVISAVLPFSCPAPHAITINVMAQGGASGSPVFLPDSGKVIGVLYGGLNDIGITSKYKDIYKLPTNVTYVVPSHYLMHVMKKLESENQITLPPDTLSLDQMIANSKPINIFDKHRGELRRIDSDGKTA